MGILVVVGFLFGMILGQFFKCYVLVPACALAIVLVLASPVHMDNNHLGSFLQFVMLNVSLQIGYVAGGIFFASISVCSDSKSPISTRSHQVSLRRESAKDERHVSADARRTS
jgi:hypothetical protein